MLTDELRRRAEEIETLTSCSNLLGWDEETMMPAAGAEQRGRQLALLAGLVHARCADPDLQKLLDDARASTPAEHATLDILRRAHRRAARVPRSLVEEQKRIYARAQRAWVDARQQRSFAVFEPWLTKIVALKREEGRCLAESPDLYQPFVDEFEPAAHAEILGALLDDLAGALQPLVQRFVDNPKKGNRALLRRSFPVDGQRAFVERVVKAMGFDLGRGRIDLTTHPFCTGIGPGDVRIALRFSEGDLRDGLYAGLHEAGHAMYEQNLPEELAGLPAYGPRSLGVHESQSRLWENLVGRSYGFAEWMLPQLKSAFPGVVDDVDVDSLWRAVNVVERDTNRVRADEATYNLHIAVRFDLERALLSGALEVSDLPAAWGAAYARIVGVTPADDVEGVLQDGHWSAGLFGYFPTYTLGNLVASQLFEAAESALPSLHDDIARGQFAPLLLWLVKNVHMAGGTELLPDLVERVTGQPLSPMPFLRHLEKKAEALEG